MKWFKRHKGWTTMFTLSLAMFILSGIRGFKALFLGFAEAFYTFIMNVGFGVVKAIGTLIEGNPKSALVELIYPLLDMAELALVKIPSRLESDPLVGFPMLVGLMWFFYLIAWAIWGRKKGW